MSRAKLTTAAAIGLIGALMTSQAQAQSAGGNDAEIALLKQQLRLMEQKLDKLQKQTAANTSGRGESQRQGRRQAKAEQASAQRQRRHPGQGSGRAVRRRRDDAEQPADHLHRGRSELRCDHQPRAFRRRRLRLSSQHRGDRAAAARRRRQCPPRAHRRDRQILRRLELRADLRFRRLLRRLCRHRPAPAARPSASCRAARCPASRTPISATPASSRSAASSRSKAASWTCPTRSTKPRVRTTSCSWSAPPPASSRTNIAAGDFRSAFGARWYNDMFWAGAYVTGPTTGAIHSASSINPNGTTEQYRRGCPRRGTDRQRQRLLAAPRRRCANG